MPIVLRHEAAGIPAGQNPNRKYGQSMVLQQQQADQNMRLRAQDAQYDMQRIGAMAQMRQPSIGEEASMLDQEIRSGLYDPDTVRALRDDERMIRQIMRDRRIDGTQRAQALENIQSRMRMMRATGKRMEPTMQPIMQGGAQPSVQTPRTAQAAFRADPKLEDRFMALVNETPGSENMTYEQKLQRAIGFYNERERALADPSSQPQGQPASQQPNAPAPAQGAPSPTTTSAMPPGSFTGGVPFGGVNPVLAQGGMQQDSYRVVGQGPKDPKGVQKTLLTDPPQYVLNDGTKVQAIWDNGGWVPDINQTGPRSMMYNRGGSQPNAPSGQSAYQPTGEINVPTVYGASPVLPSASQPSQQQGSPGRKSPAYISIAPGGGRQQGSGQVGDSQQSPVYSPDGKFLGDPRLYDQAGANYIRQQVSPLAPPSQLPPSGRSGLDAAVGNNMDTIYDLANMDRSVGTNYFDPENPAYAAMRGPDQSILNPAQNTGRFMGRYGLGGIDYGINPATGNRVTASIRPGGTMPEYDEPVGAPGTAMGGQKGTVTWQGRKGKKSETVSPGEQWSNANPYPEETPAAQKPVDSAKNAPPPRPTLSRNDPRFQDAMGIVNDPRMTGTSQLDAAIKTLASAGVTLDEIAEIESRRGQSATPRQQPSAQPEQPSREALKKAYMIVSTGQYRDVMEFEKAKKLLKQDGFSDKEINDLYTGRSKRPLSEPKPTESEIQQMTDRLQSGSLSEPERELIIGILKSAGVDINAIPSKSQGSAPSRAKTLGQRSASQGKYADSGRGTDKQGGVASTASTPYNPTSSSLLGQLEQADQDAGRENDSSSIQKGMRTWTNTAGKNFEGALVEGSIEAASRQPIGNQRISIRRKDGQVFDVPISLLSEEDQNFLMTQYNLGIVNRTNQEKDWLGRYGVGEKSTQGKVNLKKNQTMNPRTSGYDQERRDPNPEYRQRGEKSPTASPSRAKKTS